MNTNKINRNEIFIKTTVQLFTAIAAITAAIAIYMLFLPPPSAHFAEIAGRVKDISITSALSSIALSLATKR